MTAARCHLPDQTTDIERCTSELRDVFVPDQERVHAYCAAHAATLHQQEVHAAVALPSKAREVVTDLAGARSRFTRTFHGLMTQFARRHHGWIDHVWANDRPWERVCTAEDDEDRERAIFEEAMLACVETWLEPVRAGECDHPGDYDGFLIGPDDWGETMTLERPALASDRTTLPAQVELTPMPPPGTDMTLEQKRAYAERLLEIHLPEARREGRLAGRKRRPTGERRRKKKRANFRGSETAVRKAEAEYELWLKFYVDCRDTFRDDQTVVFPAGTVRFRMLGAICDPNPVTRCL